MTMASWTAKIARVTAEKVKGVAATYDPQEDAAGAG